MKEKTDELYNFIQNTEPDNWFELEKAWHGIHFLLTKNSKTQEAGFLVNNGITLRDYNWAENYGVNVIDMRAFYTVEVSNINKLLAGLTVKEMKKQYDPAEMFSRDIYPAIWEKKEFFTSRFIAKNFKVSRSLDYLITNFEKLQEFISDTARKEMGIIIKYHQ